MTGRAASRRRLGAAVALSLMAGVTAGCQHDGRELREPTAPTPPTTTTSTTLPPDIVADTVDPASP
jgi:hypothetical protein